MVFRTLTQRVSRTHEAWLTLLLLLVVVVPLAGLLWFVNRAAQNERFAVRQKLLEVYRAHLALAQERLDDRWKQLGAELDAQANQQAAPALFAKWVLAGTADAVVCFDPAGHPVYPQPARVMLTQSLAPGWTEAQSLEATDLPAAAKAYARLAGTTTNLNAMATAWQAQVRCLIQARQNDEAIAALAGGLRDNRFPQATDGQGRFIAPNAMLLLIELLQASQPDQAQVWRQALQTQLLDYDSGLLASQRLLLMRELHRLFPQAAAFPTLAAEALAAQYLERDATNRHVPVLQMSPLPGVWQFASASGRIVLLHRTETLPARLRAACYSPGLPAEVRLDFIAPGHEKEGALLSLPAGPQLPGWRLALSLNDQKLFETIANQQIGAYLWGSGLVGAAVVMLSLLALGMVRRQLALTQLRNDLVANVTHELKTPLASMRLLVETLLASPQLEEQTTREYLALIARENIRLSRLIGNFLTFSRIERNKYNFDFHPVPVAAIVNEAVAAMHERLNAPGCHFEMRLAPELPALIADADALVTTLVNLLDNACKYTGENKRIGLEVRLEQGQVRFAVSDNGIGLTPRDQQQIFKRFYRANPLRSPTVGGCGLGLSIVQFIVTAHHGTIQVASEPGHGSIFTVSLPAGETAAGTPKHP